MLYLTFVGNEVQFRPALLRNVTYIVAAVVFNEAGEVLMTQEAFYPCTGQWYLPSGRVQPNEDIRVFTNSF